MRDVDSNVRAMKAQRSGLSFMPYQKKSTVRNALPTVIVYSRDSMTTLMLTSGRFPLTNQIIRNLSKKYNVVIIPV